MKYLKTWTGINPRTNKKVTRMRIVSGAKALSHELNTQEDEVYYKLTEENIEHLEREVDEQMYAARKLERELAIQEIDRKISDLVKYRDFIDKYDL